MNKNLNVALKVVFLAVLLAGCATRSISNSGPPGHNPGDNPFYHGELTEFQVLGISPKQQITDAEIQHSLATATDITLQPDEAIMVVQSGAAIPDSAMLKALGEYYRAGAFTGVPPAPDIAAAQYSKALRLAAAKGGYKTILVYWGQLDSGTRNGDSKAISWIPVIGWSINDETELMRIHLKMALVDVASGDWKLFTPPPFEASKSSDFFTRTSTDQSLVTQLKAQAYQAAAERLYKRFSADSG